MIVRISFITCNMNVLEKIKEIRSEKRISQSDIAEYLGIAHNNYGRIERGEGELSVTRLFKIAEFLKVSPNELLGFEMPKSKEKNEIGDDESSKKIEDLEKRIKELEDKIKDKEIIVNFQEDKIKEFIKALDMLVEEYVSIKAGTYNVVHFVESNNDEKDQSLKIRKREVFDGSELPRQLEKFKKYLRMKKRYEDKHPEEIIKSAFERNLDLTSLIYRVSLVANGKLKSSNSWDNAFAKYISERESKDDLLNPSKEFDMDYRMKEMLKNFILNEE